MMLVLLWFVEAMNNKLLANQHKRHWTDRDTKLGYLRMRLKQEVGELCSVLDRNPKAGRGRRTWVEDVTSECADVANFAMMIADKAKQLHDNGEL